MLENATFGDGLGVASQSLVPDQVGGRVVGTVDIVVVEDDRLVVKIKGEIVGAVGAARLSRGRLGLLLGGGGSRLGLGLGLLLHRLRLGLGLGLDVGRLGSGRLLGGGDDNSRLLLHWLGLGLDIGGLGSGLRLRSTAHRLLGIGGRLRSRLLRRKEDGGGGRRLLGDIALGNSDSDILINPLGHEGTLHEALLERSADGAGRGHNGASADKEQRRLHGDRYRSTRRK